MNVELEKIMKKARGIPRPRPRIYAGTRDGKTVWMRNKSSTYDGLCRKHPDGVLPKWKVNILRILHRGVKVGNPWFSDVLTVIMKWTAK